MVSEEGASRPKLWSRSLIVLMELNFCSALSFYLIMVKITQFAVETYSVSTSVAGLTITAYVISALFSRILFGGKIDEWGVKRAIAIGAGVNAVAMVLYVLPLGFIPLMIVRIAHGFGFAMMSGAAAAGAALVIPAERYGEGIGYYSMMQALATGIGPFVAILLTNTFEGYFPMFAFAAAVAVLAFASVVLLQIPSQPGAAKASQAKAAANQAEDASQLEAGQSSAPSSASQQPHGIGRFIQLSVVPVASVLFLAYIGYAGILSFVTLYAAELGLDDAVGLYFVVYAIVILVSRPLVGRRIDRLGENSTIYFCLASLVIGFVLLAFASNGFMLLLSAAFVGFGIGATQSIIQAVIARDAPPDQLGKANSTFFMSMDLGSGLGPVIIGAIIPFIGYSGSYLVLAVVAVVAIIDYHLVHGRTHKRAK